jgi:hypothetical protein
MTGCLVRHARPGSRPQAHSALRSPGLLPCTQLGPITSAHSPRPSRFGRTVPARPRAIAKRRRAPLPPSVPGPGRLPTRRYPAPAARPKARRRCACRFRCRLLRVACPVERVPCAGVVSRASGSAIASSHCDHDGPSNDRRGGVAGPPDRPSRSTAPAIARTGPACSAAPATRVAAQTFRQTCGGPGQDGLARTDWPGQIGQDGLGRTDWAGRIGQRPRTHRRNQTPSINRLFTLTRKKLPGRNGVMGVDRFVSLPDPARRGCDYRAITAEP